jgi:hypothetical protein
VTETKIAVSSLAMDLKRVSLSYWKGSDKVAERFVQEALKRQEELRELKVEPYVREKLMKLTQILTQPDKKKLAEDALTYSIIFQNYAVKSLK